MAPGRASTDRDILLDAIVQRLKAGNPTASWGGRIEKAVATLRKMERHTALWEHDPEGREEFLREVARGLAAKIIADQRPSRLEPTRREWETLARCVQAIVTTAPVPDGYLPPRRRDIETALCRLAKEWLDSDPRPSGIRHILDNAKDRRGIALQLLWMGRKAPDKYNDPEDLRRALKRVAPEAPW